MDILLRRLLALLQVCDFTLTTQLMGVSETSANNKKTKPNMHGPAGCQRSTLVAVSKLVIYYVFLLAPFVSLQYLLARDDFQSKCATDFLFCFFLSDSNLVNSRTAVEHSA